MKHTKVFNSYGQVVEVQYEILKSIAYWMTIQYDSAGRTTTCDIRVGVDSNVTRYTYEYDADSQLQSASVNERPQWRYSYDLNGNINLLSQGTSARWEPQQETVFLIMLVPTCTSAYYRVLPCTHPG